MGDYFANNELLIQEKLRIYNVLLGLKKTFLDKMILLIGNVDEQYFLEDPDDFKSYRFDKTFYKNVHESLVKNKDLFHYCYQINYLVFSHGGISSSWFYNNADIFQEIEKKFNFDAFASENLAVLINAIANSEHKKCLYDPIGPLACTRNDLIKSYVTGGPLETIDQVIGNSITEHLYYDYKFQDTKKPFSKLNSLQTSVRNVNNLKNQNLLLNL